MSTDTKSNSTKTDDTPVVRPAIVDWVKELPGAPTQWDDVVAAVRARNDHEWARVTRPTAWTSGTSNWFRRQFKDLEMYVPHVGKLPQGVERTPPDIYIRRKPLASDNGES